MWDHNQCLYQCWTSSELQPAKLDNHVKSSCGLGYFSTPNYLYNTTESDTTLANFCRLRDADLTVASELLG
jgi:hypothetical protein